MTKADWLNIYEIVGCALEVYNTLGRGLHEDYYQLSMEIELRAQDVPYERQYEIPIVLSDN